MPAETFAQKPPSTMFPSWNSSRRIRTYHSLSVVLILVCCARLARTGNSDPELFQRTEGHLVTLLRKFLQRQLDTLDAVRSFLPESILTGSTHAREDPLLNFRLTRRLTVDLEPLRDTLLQYTDLADQLVQASYLQPSENDLQGAARALVRLQDTYELNLTDLAAGRIQGMQSVPLTARDCLYLGKHSFNYGLYGRSIQWFQQALAEADDSPDFRAEVYPFLSTAIEVHDQLIGDNQADSTVDTLGQVVGWPPPDTRGVARDEGRKVKLRQIGSDEDDHHNYRDLCRGRVLLPLAAQSQLHCFLSSRGQAYLNLQPIRVEELSRSPTVLQFHDILTDKECKQVQQLAAPKLSQAEVQGFNGSQRELSVQRTSQTAWLQRHLYARVAKLNRRVQDIAGLSSDEDSGHCEVVQVASYGAGGFYQPHFDYLFVDRPKEEQMQMDPKELEMGDRTATLMFYLSEVPRGGATVFPRLGIGLWPKKGSAVFWFNLLRNGSGDPLTLHGACPVLHGQKWVANYWFREKGQSFLRKCSLNMSE